MLLHSIHQPFEKFTDLEIVEPRKFRPLTNDKEDIGNPESSKFHISPNFERILKGRE